MKSNRVIRKRGYIRSTTGTNFPTNLLFIDTESDINQINIMTDILPLRLGVAIHVILSKKGEIKDRKVYIFHSTAEFLLILGECSKPRLPLNVFAHNIRFDIRVLDLPEQLTKHGSFSDYPIMNERLFIWYTRFDNRTINYIDTANFAVQSVAKLGSDFGFDKLSVDFATVKDDELVKYCQRDVEIIEKFVIEYINFLRQNNLGSFCTTLASQAFRAWRQRFMPHSVYIHDYRSALDIERKSYTGGRVECFYIGEKTGETFYYLDVNSMYPYVMTQDRIPVRLVVYTDTPRPYALKNSVLSRYTVAEVIIKTDIPAYPHKRDDKLIFPVGTFRAILHQPELEYALKHNHVVQCISLASYECADIFTEYVNFFYGVKQNATLTNNLSWRFIAKIFLNSLYGKFGQQGINRVLLSNEGEKIVERMTGYNVHTGNFYQIVNWYGDILKEERGGESTYSFPAIAGAVTAYARMHLWNYIETAGRDNVFYCDTDSLIVNEAGYKNLAPYLDENRLGFLKIEKTSDRIVINNAKDYEFGSEKKTKGVPKDAILLDKNAWLYLQFEGFYTWLKRGGKGAPIIQYRIKTRKSAYDKGNINPATGNITPIELNES